MWYIYSCVNSATRVSHDTLSCIGHVFTNITQYIRTATLDTDITDHYLVSLNIKINSPVGQRQDSEYVGTSLNTKKLIIELETESWTSIYDRPQHKHDKLYYHINHLHTQ